MLLAICGTQSTLTSGIRQLVAVIAAQTIGMPYQVHASTKDQLSEVWKDIPQANRGSVLLFSDLPQLSLRQLLADSNIPTIICFDEFEEILSGLMSKTHPDFMTSLRIGTQCIVLTSELAATTKSLRMTSDRYDAPVMAIAREILDFFHIGYDDQHLDKLRKTLCGDQGDATTLRDFIAAQIPNALTTPDFLTTLPSDQRHVLAEVAQAYNPLTKGRAMEAVTWQRRCFQDGDTPDRQLLGSKLLVGPARCLFFGPYIHMPLGHWNCELEIEVNGCQADTMALVDVYDDEATAAVSMRLPRRGVYSIDIPFQVRRTDSHLQFRMMMLKGALEGELLLHKAKVTRAVPPRDDENLRLTYEAQ